MSSYTGKQIFKLVSYSLKDFLHPDREKVEEMVVFLHRSSRSYYSLKGINHTADEKESRKETLKYLPHLC